MNNNNIRLAVQSEPEIDAILIEADSLESKSLWNDADALLRRELAERPGSAPIISELLYVTSQLIRRSPSEVKRADEALMLGREALDNTDDADLRASINRSMCFISSISTGPESAREYYNAMPSVDSAREPFAAYVLRDDELKLQLQKNIESFITYAATAAKQLGYRESGELSCRLLGKSVELYELLYEDGDCGDYFADMTALCLDIAAVKAKSGAADEAFEYLEKALSCAEKYAGVTDGRHTSVLADRLGNLRPDAPRYKLRELVIETVRLGEDFAALKGDPRIKKFMR